MPTAGIPLIDLAGPEPLVAPQLVAAAHEHGFVYVRNLGRASDLPPAAIAHAFSLSEKLFAAPPEEKRRCGMRRNRGLADMHAETLDPDNQKVGDFEEAFNFGEFVDGKAQQPLPSPIAADEPRIDAFAALCRKLCLRILRLLGLGLDVGDFFASAHFVTQDGSGTTLRFLRYPPPGSTPHSGRDMRAGAHSDYGSVTLLFRLRGQAGLEVLARDGAWAAVPVCPPGTEDDPSPPILVNIGDLLSYWTNGLFRSAVHRVVFPTAGAAAVAGESAAEARYSIAFFCHPEHATRLEPVPSQRVRDHRPAQETPGANPYAERRVMTAEEHLSMRLKASFGALYDGDGKDAVS